MTTEEAKTRIASESKSRLPSTYNGGYNKFRRKPEYKISSVISGVFSDILSDITNKVIDPETQIFKLKILGGFICCGLLGGHTYSAYRGFTRLNLYSRHLLVGGGMGTLCTFPVITFMNTNNKQYPNLYMIVRGGIFGSICGLAHRGSYRYMIPYGIMGIIIHGFILTIWYELIKPIYYFHILSWPDYIPPKWWPYQPLSGMEEYLNELQIERLNVTYPEDLQYFKKLDTMKEEQLQKRKAIEFEQEFIYNSEILEKQQLEHDTTKPKNVFGI